MGNCSFQNSQIKSEFFFLFDFSQIFQKKIIMKNIILNSIAWTGTNYAALIQINKCFECQIYNFTIRNISFECTGMFFNCVYQIQMALTVSHSNCSVIGINFLLNNLKSSFNFILIIFFNFILFK